MANARQPIVSVAWSIHTIVVVVKILTAWNVLEQYSAKFVDKDGAGTVLTSVKHVNNTCAVNANWRYVTRV